MKQENAAIIGRIVTNIFVILAIMWVYLILVPNLFQGTDSMIAAGFVILGMTAAGAIAVVASYLNKEE